MSWQYDSLFYGWEKQSLKEEASQERLQDFAYLVILWPEQRLI